MPRIVNLVLYSPDPIYTTMYELTRQYYARFAPDVTTIYYCFNSTIAEEVELRDDVLYVQGTESYIPGILVKTLKAFGYVLQHYTFDYLIRSNISTIVDIPLLSEYFDSNDLQYGGKWVDLYHHPNNALYASGTSILFSYETLRKVMDLKQHCNLGWIDDYALGALLHTHLPEVKQTYLPLETFFIVPDFEATQTTLADYLKPPPIFYRNRHDHDRRIDLWQMQLIIEHLRK